MPKYEVKYTSNRNVVFSCKYHAVWCPKYRRDVLDEEVASYLERIIFDVCQESNADRLELEIMPDHVHLLVEVDPQFGIHRLLKKIKGRSSRILRNTFQGICCRLPSLWTNSYFISTVGGAPLSVVKQYIKDQKDV